MFCRYWNGANLFADPNATPKVVLIGVMVLWGLVQVHMVSAAMVQLLRAKTDHALKRGYYR